MELLNKSSDACINNLTTNILEVKKDHTFYLCEKFICIKYR